MGNHASGNILQGNIAVHVIDVEFSVNAGHKNVAVIHGFQRERRMHRHSHRHVHRALDGVCADADLVVFRFHIESGRSHGDTLHAGRWSTAFTTPLATAFSALTPAFISHMRFHHDLFYVPTFDRDAAVEE